MLINPRCCNWMGQVSRMIGSPSSIIHHPLLYLLSTAWQRRYSTFTSASHPPVLPTSLFCPFDFSYFLSASSLFFYYRDHYSLLAAASQCRCFVWEHYHNSIGCHSWKVSPAHLGRQTTGCQPEMKFLTHGIFNLEPLADADFFCAFRQQQQTEVFIPLNLQHIAPFVLYFCRQYFCCISEQCIFSNSL